MAFLTEAANRGSISTGYDVDYSCKFESDNAESLYKDQVQGTQTTWTFSTWLKRTELSTTSNSYHHVWAAGSSSSDNGTKFYFRGDSSFPGNQIFFYMDNGGSQYFHGATAQSFRDPAAWYHIVWAVDTTQGTAGNRSKVYINGVLQTLIGVSGAAYADPPQNSSTRVNDNGGVMYVGAQNLNGGNRFNGYLAETVLVDGSQLAATDFGEFDAVSGIWKPKDVSGLSFGTRGFYLDYSDPDNLGHDADGSAEFTESYLTAADQATDTPTNNFCVPDIIHVGQAEFGMGNITEGATKMDNYGHNWYAQTKGTMGVTKGKWYWELEYETRDSSYGLQTYVGVHTFSGDYHQSANTSYLFGDGTGGKWGFLYQAHNGYYYTWSNASTQVILYGVTAFGATDISNGTNVLGIALNMDDGEISYYKNNVAMTYDSGGANPVDLGHVYDSGEIVFPTFVFYTNTGIANFGGYTARAIASAETDANGYGSFEYAPPSGYYALCTKNLAEYG